MDKLFFSILFISHIGFLQAQYTQVPDPNFEQALINLGIDSEGKLDGQFLTADAQGITVLDVEERNINDLTGLEAFIDLHDLWASNNNLTSVDLSMLPNATIWTVTLGNNNITSIDLSPITNVVNLGLYGNNLQHIEVIDFPRLFILSASNQNVTDISLLNCPNLQVVEFSNTQIQNINFSQCPSLRRVTCHESQIQSLDFTYNQNLEQVQCSNTPLTNIQLPNNPNLEELNVNACQLTELDVTSCSSLWLLECMFNSLTELDLSGNPLLERLLCRDNHLTEIDLSYNTILSYVSLSNNLIEGILFHNNHYLMEYFYIGNNLITSLDLSSCSGLNTAHADDNPYLEIVDLKNGGNLNMNSFTAYNCSSLTCVVVDDPNASNDNISVGDATLVGTVEECEGIYISEFELQNQISLYPNPVKDVLFIINNSNFEFEKITVYDILGKVVRFEKSNLNQINLVNLNSGVLFVKLEMGNRPVTKKIIKE